MLNKIRLDLKKKYNHIFEHKIIFDILFLLVLSIVPFLSYGNVIIPETDLGYDINPSRSFLSKIFLWDGSLNFGSPVMNTVNIYSLFNVSLSELSVSSSVIKQIWLILLLFVSGLSMYYFMGVFKDKGGRLLKVTSSVTYMYSLYLIRTIMVASTMAIGYAILPLILGFYISGLRIKKDYLYYAILISLTSIIFSNINFTYIAINAGAIFVFLLIYLFKHKGANFLYVLKFNVSILFLVFLISSWWVIPLVKTSTASQEYITERLSVETPETYNIRSSYLETFRLLGDLAFSGQYKGVPFVSFSKFYMDNPIWITSTFLFTVLSLCGLFFVRSRMNRVYMLSLLVVFSAMAVGAYPITNPTIIGRVYLWCYEHIPLFSIFRNGYKSVAIISFVYAILSGYFVSSVYVYLKNKFEKTNNSFQKKIHFIFIALIFGLILLNSFPLWMGKMFDDKKFKLVPSYWYEAGNYLNKQPLDSRVLMFPDSYFPVYYWGKPGGDVSLALINKPVIESMGRAWGYKKFTKLIYDSFLDQDAFSKIVALCNIKYVIQRNDIDWEYYDADSPEKIGDMLSSRNELQFEKRFGYLDLYRVKDSHLLPRIYSAQTLNYIHGDVDSFVKSISFIDYNLKDGILLIDSVLDKEKISNIFTSDNIVFSNKELDEQIQTPKLEYKQVNPTKYIVNVYGASEPFPLVFSENFHSGWKIYAQPMLAGKGSGQFISEENQGSTQNQNLDGGKFFNLFFRKPVSDDKHFLVNGYANAWWIDVMELEKGSKVKKNEDGSYDFSINIEFEPQKYFYLGLIISGLTLAGCLGYLGFSLLRRRKKTSKQNYPQPSE